jgi:type I restriction enzyme, S subunit
MNGEWEMVRLEDLCTLVADCPHSTPKWTDSGVFVIRSWNVREGRLNFDKLSFTDENTYQDRVRRAKPSKGDIVITREAPMGEVCMIPENLQCCLGQRLVLLRPNSNVVNNHFLLFSLQSPFVNAQILVSEGTGSTVSNLRIPDLKDLKIPLPPLSIQTKIAEILSSLDDKIALNREMNASLEAMAQTLFKEWFIKPTTEGVVDSVKIGSLLETVSKTYKFGNKSEIIFLNTGDILEGSFLHGNYSEVATLPGQAKKSIQKNDILFSEIRPANKRYAFVNFDANEYVVSTKLMVLRSKKLNPKFLYFLITQPSVLKELQHLAESRSGTFPQITFDLMANLNVFLPNEEIIAAFTNIWESFFDKILENNTEIATLTRLRDSLLPKLLRGEIAV